ncbi:MAG: DUF3568 family protein [Candidatus Omnitrophica bacterium]|nr:DUF3568 family protein [Candidatus Omnitrophota bacterium]
MKKLVIILLTICLLPTLTGCFALLAGAGGTALWQAGKVVFEELVSMEAGVKAVEAAFKDNDITLKDKVIKSEVTQIRGKDRNGTKVAVDVFSKGKNNSKIEIRYGIGEETAGRELLNQIKKKL